jgi:hypothetical protein
MRRSFATVECGLMILIMVGSGNAAPVVGWSKDTSFGGGTTATLTNASTNAPTLGNGAANNADNTAIYAGFPLLSLSNGQRITLFGSAQLIGTSANADFRWGLFKNDGVGAATGGWLGYMASAESITWSKNPSGGSFATATFASVTENRAVTLGQSSEPNGIPFGPGTYDFTLAAERFNGELDISIAISNSATGFSIVSPAYTEIDPSRLIFSFDQVGILAGSALDADQIRFRNIDVAVTEIARPTLEVYSSGLIVLTNPTGQSEELTQYEISSNAASLNPSGWVSFDDRENNDPVGSGWDQAGGSSAKILAEVNLLSNRTLAVGEHVSLGSAFAAGATPDVAFHYTAGGEIRRGLVEYVQSGDYNRDGDVDSADYVVWRNTYGEMVAAGAMADGDGSGQVDDADLTVFRNNFGGGGFGLGQTIAAPEPGIAAVLCTIVPLLLQRTGQRLGRPRR